MYMMCFESSQDLLSFRCCPLNRFDILKNRQMKYCSFHNEDSFPIYDQYVEKMLKHYGAKGNLKDYGDFCSAIDTFKKGNGLDSCSLKDIDIYLWMKGKSL